VTESAEAHNSFSDIHQLVSSQPFQDYFCLQEKLRGVHLQIKDRLKMI